MLNIFKFLKVLFTGKRSGEIDEELVVNEFWKTDFHHHDKSRFCAESTDRYETEFVHDGFLLSCKQKGVFAWSINPVYRYANFVIEAVISFPDNLKKESQGNKNARHFLPGETRSEGNDSAGAFSAGFLFRYLNDSTFYSLLVSEKGFVRMDAVINGTPVPVLGWTGIAKTADGKEIPCPPELEGQPAPYKDKSVFSLKLIAQHTSFTIILNDRWIAECEDETIQAPGKIAFAAQNWNTYSFCQALLKTFSIESRPFEVEALYTRWNQYVKIPGEARVSLAQTKYAMGQYSSAMVELKKAWKTKEPDVDDLLFAAQICLVQNLYPEAEDFARRAAEEAEKNNNPVFFARANAELGGILYARNDFDGLKSLLKKMPAETVELSPFLLNLAGHAAFQDGDFKKAAEKYIQAAEKMPEQPLFSFHAGNALSASGKTKKAVDYWLAAGTLFLRENDFLDLDSVFPELEKNAPDDGRVICLGVKYFYASGNSSRLAEYVKKAEGIKSDDSSLWYVLGLWNSEQGNQEKALDFYKRAVKLEPDFALYRFRVAENLFNRELDYREALDEALAVGGNDGWIHNLSALAALRENDLKKAEEEIAVAREALPEEKTVLVNYAEIERRRGNLDQALKLFDKSDADLLRAGANLLAEEGRHEEADEWYVLACKRRPFDADLLVDRAANCIKLEFLNEADDLLGKSLEIMKTPRAYQLISFLAGRKGEYARAEVALLTAISEFPENTELIYELSAVYMVTGHPEKAAELEKDLRGKGRNDLADKLAQEILETSSNIFSCSVCGREWRVPKNIPDQGRLAITAQPPDDLPAGKCPDCGAVYCIGCAKEHLDSSGRFHCASCGSALKLSDSNIIWLLSEWQDRIIAEKRKKRESASRAKTKKTLSK